MTTHVVIVGAGYAGAVAAKRLLAKGNDLEVTVINPRTEFVERIRLHQFALGNHPATVPLTEALHPDARLVVGRVEAIEPDENRVRLDDGSVLTYDHLVYAVGSSSRMDDIPGAREHAFTVGEFEPAQQLQQKLVALPADSAVIVVGGGFTGIETVAEVAEQRPDLAVTLVSDSTVAREMSDSARRKILRALTRLGVDIVEDRAVTRIHDAGIDLTDGRTVASDCTVVAVASEVPALARISGLPTDPAGRLRVDETLTCAAHSNIVGAGDAVAVDGLPLRMSCQAAVPLGAHAADTLLHALAGTSPAPVKPSFVGQCLSLGRRSAVVQLTDSRDEIRNVAVGGRAVALVKEQVCSYTYNWGVNPRRPALATWS